MTRLRVTRHGGFAGVARSGELDTAAVGDGAELDAILEWCDLPSLAPASGCSRPEPDRFSYTIEVDGSPTVIREQDLPAKLRSLVDRVLDAD